MTNSNTEINYVEVCFALVGTLYVYTLIKHPEKLDKITDIIEKIIK